MPEEDRWAIAHAEEDGMPVLFRFRSDFPVKDTAQFPYLVSILWHYDGARNGGMPDEPTLAQMNRVEDALEIIDRAREAFLMLTVTGNNRREWIWYTDDRDRYMALVNRAMPRQPKFPLDFATSEDPSWTTYRIIRDASHPSDDAP
ncbi:MAG TPA: DUF695 domain-containing protein [Thermoanaerobaculia bacterium]